MPDYIPAIPRRNWEKHGERVSVLDFGAKADGVILFDGAINEASTTLTSALATFADDLIGKVLWIEGAGAGGADLLTAITSINSPTSLEVADAALTAVANEEFRFGTDSTAGIQAALDLSSARGICVMFPRGNYLITVPLTVHDNCALVGQGYCHLPFFTNEVSSNLVGLGNFPLIDYPETSYDDPLISFNCEKLTFRGTSRTGSKGIHIGNLFGIILRDMTFDYFGDEAIHIELGIDGTFSNLFGTDNLLVRTRATKTGGFYIGCSDTIADGVRNTTSVSFPPGAIVGGEYGDGNGAGIMVVGGNSHWSNSFAHGSQIGWHVTPSGSLTTFVNCRADLNQGEGWEIDSFNCNFVACRSHANSLDSPGAFSAFRIDQGGNQFTGCQVTFNGAGPNPLNNEMLHGFEDNASGVEANYFSGNYISDGALTGLDYISTVGHINTINDSLTRDPAGRTTHRFFGDVSVRGVDDLTGLFLVNTSLTGVGTDETVWCLRPYQDTLRLEVWADDYSAPLSVMQIGRTGTVADYVQMIAGLIKLDGDVLVGNGKIIQLVSTLAKIVAGSGSPEGSVTAVGGSLYMDGNGRVWGKIQGSGNTGWSKLLSYYAPDLSGGPMKIDGVNNVTTSAISLAAASFEVTGTLPLANGGLGATTAPGGRIALDVYSKSDVDGMIASVRADMASAGASTSTNSGHSHTQS